VLFPDSGKKIIKSRKGLNVLETKSMEEAVKFAYKYTPKGEICLLSCASPSYSVWKDFEEKGDQFKFWVKYFSELKNEKPI
jgi:UDP-N-acetylmuramoylalanine--D-glutamate ligase